MLGNLIKCIYGVRYVGLVEFNIKDVEKAFDWFRNDEDMHYLDWFRKDEEDENKNKWQGN